MDAFVAAAERVAQANGLNLPIGGNREISVADLAGLTVSLLGGSQKVLVRPTSVRATETLRSWCDNAEAQTILGWAPKTTLEQGIRRTAQLAAAYCGAVPQHEKV